MRQYNDIDVTLAINDFVTAYNRSLRGTEGAADKCVCLGKFLVKYNREKTISYKQQTIKSIKESLKYADHGAYGQDLEQIALLEREVNELIKQQGENHE